MGDPPRLLLVIRDRRLRHALQEAAKSLGIGTVDSVGSVEEALTAAEAHSPDVLMLSLANDAAGGLDFIRRQRDRTPNARIVAIALADLETEARNAGSDFFLRIPFSLTDLRQALPDA